MTCGSFIIILSVLDLILFIIGLALASQNKRGNFDSYAVWESNDVVASFGIIGNLLGIMLSLWILILGGKGNWERMIVVVWVILGGIMLWFLCAAIGIWCVWLYLFAYIQMWTVELGIEVVASLIFIILMGLVVSRLRTRDLKGVPKK